MGFTWESVAWAPVLQEPGVDTMVPSEMAADAGAFSRLHTLWQQPTVPPVPPCSIFCQGRDLPSLQPLGALVLEADSMLLGMEVPVPVPPAALRTLS